MARTNLLSGGLYNLRPVAPPQKVENEQSDEMRELQVLRGQVSELIEKLELWLAAQQASSETIGKLQTDVARIASHHVTEISASRGTIDNLMARLNDEVQARHSIEKDMSHVGDVAARLDAERSIRRALEAQLQNNQKASNGVDNTDRRIQLPEFPSYEMTVVARDINNRPSRIVLEPKK